MDAPTRVSALRALMRKHGLDAFVIPSEDAHMSEYVASCDQRRAYFTGFTGSAGTGLVTMDHAYLWTDGRYFVQAEKELDSSVFTLMKVHEDPNIEEWMAANIGSENVVGIDGRTVSVSGMNRFGNALMGSGRSGGGAGGTSAKGIKICALPLDVPNFVDEIWAEKRPACPSSTVVLHPIEYAGKSVGDKMKVIRQKMKEKEVSMLMVCGLDEVAWLLNLRGADVEYNPVFWSYVTITVEDATLYAESSRFGEGVNAHLESNHVKLRPYETLLSDMRERCWDPNSRIWLDPNVCNYAILECLEKASKKISILKKQGPIALMKAAKNSIELEGTRNAHIRDGVALSKFLCWIEDEVASKGREPTECEAADVLDALRAKQELYVSPSFPTISSSGANAAIVHYRPEVNTCAKVTKDRIYLVDSGGQYRDGTTDVTRTLHFGTPTDWERECFTRVLCGHIALDSAVFPKGTTGQLLDGFARQMLWKAGLDYKHGTGHGVGSFLNVHEGPHLLSFKSKALSTALDAGFLTSNEPGYYEENKFGIRIENVCVVDKFDSGNNGNGKSFFKLEHVTFAPIQTKLIKLELLSSTDKNWIDEYHTECWEKLSPLLTEDDDQVTKDWLWKNTRPIAEQFATK